MNVPNFWLPTISKGADLGASRASIYNEQVTASVTIMAW